MSFAVMGSKVGNLIIEDSESINTSFPNFIEKFNNFLTEERINKFTTWMTEMIDALGEGDFRTMWTKFFEGAIPAFKVLLDVMKGLVASAFDSVGLTGIGDWITNFTYAEFNGKNLSLKRFD